MFFVVGETATATRIAVCVSEKQAAEFIKRLVHYEDGRYYIDKCRDTVIIDHAYLRSEEEGDPRSFIIEENATYRVAAQSPEEAEAIWLDQGPAAAEFISVSDRDIYEEV